MEGNEPDCKWCFNEAWQWPRLVFNQGAIKQGYTVYGTGHIIKDYSDKKREILQPAPQGLLFLIVAMNLMCTISPTG